MRATLLERTLLACILLLCANFTLGCAAVVVPLKPGSTSMPDSGHGLVFGRIHLTRSGEDHHPNLRLPIDMKWWVTEETQGRRFVIDHLPIDGPFAVMLPAGSYRLTEVILDNPVGIWQASLSTMFNVRPRECTYLGTTNLHVKTGFFDGLITRQVLNEEQLAEDDLRRLFGDRTWPVMWAPLASSTESAPIILTFQTQGTQLTSPP